VLITGEIGTGKELVACAMHHTSLRKDGPFVKVNCAALPENLLESKLFGHVKDAFPGASKDSRGRFELAHTGTIFLYEVGDLSPHLQQKLLRVLEEKEFEPVGSSETRKVNVRVIAASSQDLEARINDGAFREDLYYRLAVTTIKLPPLRERKDDIVPLLRHFLDKYNGETGKDIKDISPHALDLLFSYDWPGNVRELENVIERAVILSKTDTTSLVTRNPFPRFSMRWRKNSSSTPSTRFTGTRARPPMYLASIVPPSSQSSPNTR
jgi:Nif-specific regulatory protein